MTDFLVVGESVADIVRTPGEADVTHAGGSPANVAFGLGRLGHRVRLLTQLGDDPAGELIGAHLRSAGVEVVVDGGGAGFRTPSAVVTLDAAGRPTYALDVRWTLRRADLGRSAGHVHLGSVAALLAPGATAALAVVRQLRAAASVSYDPNIRPALLGQREPARARVEECVALSDVVKASDEDVDWLYPGRPLAEVAAHWLTLGPAVVLLTRGADGAQGYLRGGAGVAVPAAPVEAVDSVGAGDSFMAATLDALDARSLLGARGRAALAGVDASTATAVLTHAARAAAVTVSRAGANPPRRDELGVG